MKFRPFLILIAAIKKEGMLTIIDALQVGCEFLEIVSLSLDFTIIGTVEARELPG